MLSLVVKVTILFLLAKPAILGSGFVKDVLMNKKIDCPRATKELLTMKSEMQCVHRCLRNKCMQLNYNVDEKVRNCEVLTGITECSAVAHQINWKAMIFEVNLFQYMLFYVLIRFTITINTKAKAKGAWKYIKIL